MRALVVVALLVALAASTVALGAGGEPQRRITAADQARARAMLLRKPDFPAGVTVTRQASGTLSFACAALDESDLTLTGEADSPSFSTGFVDATSGSEIGRASCRERV